MATPMYKERLPSVILDFDRTVIQGVGTRILAKHIARTSDENVRRALALMEPRAGTGKPLLSRALVRAYIQARIDRKSTVQFYPEGYEHEFFRKGPTRVTDCAEFGLYAGRGEIKITGEEFKTIRDAWLSGMTVEQLENAQKDVENAIAVGVKDFVSWYKRLGGVVLIATNTWKQLAESAGSMIGVELIVGDEPQFVEGKFTGRVEYIGNKWKAALDLYTAMVEAEQTSIQRGFTHFDELTPSYIAPHQAPRSKPAARFVYRDYSRTPPPNPPKFVAVDDSPSQLANAQTLNGVPIGINIVKRDIHEFKGFNVADDWGDVQVLVEQLLPLHLYL